MTRHCDGCMQDSRKGCPALQQNVELPRELLCEAVKKKHQIILEEFHENNK
jgi:hypothetical protein